MYTYNATLVRVVDGDTIDVDIDLGFHLTTRQRLRLLGLDTPELPTPDGIKAKEFVSHQLDGARLIVSTQKTDSFGRWLASVWYIGADDVIYDLNKRLLNDGFAKPL